MRISRVVSAFLALAAPCVPPGPGNGSAATSATGAAADTSDDAAIVRAEQDYVDLLVQIMPEEATLVGLHARDGDLDDRSHAGFEKRISLEEQMLRDLKARFAHPHAS